jgi:hypothetical protein
MLDSLWRRDPSSGKPLIADGWWHLGIWARAEQSGVPLTIRFRRQNSAADFFSATIPLSSTWQLIERDFIVPAGLDANHPLTPGIDPPVLLLSLHLPANRGEVWVDDVVLERSGQHN